MLTKRTIRCVCLAALLLLSTNANAFRSTKVQGFTDPDYKEYVVKKVLLLVENADNDMRNEIEKRLKDKLTDKGVTLVSYRELFPPTRQWSKEDQAEILQRESIDCGLIVTVGASSSQVIPIATQTHSTGSVFGSYGSYGNQGTFNAHGNATSTTQNVYGAKSKAEFSAVLMDLGKNRTIWYGDVTVKAAGTLFVSEKGDAKGLAGAVVDGLEDQGHLPKATK